MLLPLLIGSCWLAAAAFVVMLAKMASRGDQALALAEEPARVRTTLGDLVVWERAPLVAARISGHAAVRVGVLAGAGRGSDPAAHTRAVGRARDTCGR